MAIQRVGIQFDFNANTKQAETNLNALEKTMMRLENRMRSMGAPKDEAGGFGGKQRLATQSNLSNFGESTIDLKSPIRQTEILTDNIRKGKIGWDEYGRAVKQNSAIVTQQLAQQTGAIHSAQRAGKGFQATFTPNSSLRGISGIEIGTTRMHAFGEATKAVSQNVIDMGKNLAFSARQMTVSLSMPLAIIGGLAIKQFSDIDKQLTDIAKVYDAQADGVEMSTGRIRASMKNLASELSRTQGAEIKDTLDIAQYYAQQGKTGDELRESTVQASRLMVLGDVDIDDAQKTITTLTSVVGANAKELGKYVDYLNKVEDSTQLTMSDFAKTLPTIAPLVKTFIPDDKDALMSTSASMMEASRRAGFEPKESMNAWKSMYGSFVRPAEKTEEKFGKLTAKYGEEKSLRGVVSEFKGDPVQILTELSKITKEWSAVDRGELMTQIAGKYQLSRGLGIMQAMDPNVGNNGVAMGRMGAINDELVNNPEQLADNSARQMDLIRNSANTQLKQLKQDVTMMFADLGERIFLPVMGALENVLGLAKVAYQTIASLPGPIKDLLSIGAQLTFIAGPILAALAATKMLGGFAGKIAGSFANTAASAGRTAASIMGVKMKGSGKLESKEQSIAKIQEKNGVGLNIEMQGLIEAENKARMQSVALEEEKNVKTRESIKLHRELNRVMTGSITPTPAGTPVKDPKKDLKKYQASLQSPSRNWPMAIQAKDIGPESFRRHAGKIGAPATNVSDVGMRDNKVFGSGHKLGHVGLLPKTDSTSAGLSTQAVSHIQKEVDKVNSALAVRRSADEQAGKQISRLRAERPSSQIKGSRGADAVNQKRAQIDDKISKLNKEVSARQTDASIGGQKSFGIPALEAQKAALLKASNGNSIQQAKIMSQLQAAQSAEADATKKNAAAIAAETKKRTVRGRLADEVRSAKATARNFGANLQLAGTGDTSLLKEQLQRGKETVMGMGRDVKNTEGLTRMQRESDTRAQREKAWSENTVRGGPGDYFRGHTTPKDISDAKSSEVFKNIKDALKDSPESVDVRSMIEDNEYERQEALANLKEQYEAGGADSDTARKAAQRDLDQSNLPTQAALQRETDMHMERMVTRADTLADRQELIAENAGQWASNLSNGAAAFGIIGTMATSALGIQNSLVDGALMFANGIGAVGMILPGAMEKAVSSAANFGSSMLDKFDATALGTSIGAQLGDTMGTTMSARLSTAASKIGAMFMTAMPYMVAIAAAGLAAKAAWDWHRKDSEAYTKTMQEANKSVELHAELLGYVRKEQESIEDMTYEEATDVRAKAYKENKDGRSEFVRTMSDINVGNQERGYNTGQYGKIENLNAVLSQEAVRILGDGGTDADVRSMVAAALEAAGVSDPQIIEDVKLHFKNFDVTADDLWAGALGKEVQDKMSGIGTARSSGDQAVNALSALNPFSEDSRFRPRNYDRFSEYEARDQMEIEEAYRRPSQDSKTLVESELKTFTSAINSADDEEAKAAYAEKFIGMMSRGLEEAQKSGNSERIGTVLRQNDDLIAGALKDSKMPQAQQMLAESMKDLQLSETALQSALGGTGQAAFDTPEKAAVAYAKALQETKDKGKELNDEQKLTLHNSIAAAGGLDYLADGGRNADGSLIVATATLGVFNDTLDKTKDNLTGMTAQESIDHILAPDEARMEQNRLQVQKFSDTLRNTPEEFTKRWQLTAEVNVDVEQESVDQQVANSRKAMEAGAQFAADDAARGFKERQDQAFDQIKAETDGAMKGMDAKQKASEKAFAARGKALDAQFKSETKALDKQHKEEKKVYDKQQNELDKEFAKRQRDDQRRYDKEENAKKKEFSKMQEAESELFEDEWDSKADAISGYYDNAIKAIENQGAAEEKLEQIRQRNAERERKRREYLANMANTNIDINVAVAGGNLDEAARLSNSAVSTATDYYQDQIDTESGYALEDNNAARAAKSEALGSSQSASMDAFGEIRDDATEGFSDKQELAQEKNDEELQAARDLYDAKKTLESEQYEEQKAIEAERFAERQALEAERLAAAQEAQREALEAEKAAIAERHAAEREMIQETARVKEDGARRHFEATQRALDMEIQELMSRLPTSHAEIEGWVKEVEGTYANHGVYLREGWAPEVQTGMMEAAVNAMDVATNQIREDEDWKNIGQWIGEQLRTGTLKGYGLTQAVSSVIFGNPLGDPLYPAQTAKAQSDTAKKIPLVGGNFAPGQAPLTGLMPPRRAKGGPIFGPGTETSDSIPALLSNGEHVLTAKEVKAAGGHKAVERLRNAIKSGTIGRFAVGGGVGTSTGTPGTEEELNVTVASTGTGTVADGGVMSALTTEVSSMGSMFDDTLTNTVAPAWQMFGDMMVKVKKDSIDPVLEGSKIALADYAAQTNQIMSANMNPAWVQFGQNLKMVKEGVFDVVMTDMKAGIQSLASTMATSISNEIMPKWSEGANHVRTMQDTVIAPSMQQTQAATTQTAQNFGAAADMIGVGWGRVKENSAAPVRYTIGTVYNDGLVGMWNKVADALDLDKMATHDFSFATGGVLPGYTPGKDVHHFESPTGGKLHLSGGEAIMRPEWTRAVGGASAVHKMNSDAKNGKVQKFKDGGVVDAPGGGKPKIGPKINDAKPEKEKPASVAYGMPNGTQISYGSAGFPSWVYNIGGQFGLQASTYPGHQENNVSAAGFTPNPALQNRGIDWSGPVDKMHTFAQYLVANGPSMPQLEQVIWMHPGSGQKIGWFGNRPDMGGSIYSGDYGGHQDHVHTRQSQSLDGTGSMDGVILGLGGMGMTIDPKIIAAVSKFNEEKNALKEKISAHIDAGPDTLMKAIPGKMFSGITAGMDKKIQAKMPLMGGGMAASLGAYGLNHEDHVKEIIAAAHERGLPKEAARIAIATALVESELRMYASNAVPESLSFPHEAIGSDHDSIGLFQQRQAGWGTTAERMNARASAGMFYNKLMQFDWKSMDPGAAAQKVQVSAFPAKYAPRMAEADSLIAMVGGFDANANGIGALDDKSKKTLTGADNTATSGNGYFDQGGIASGMGVMNKAVISPERVLSPRQTQAFERLVPAMDRVALGGISEDQFMQKTNFDRDAAFKKMIERNSTAQIDFTGILEKMTPILTQLTGQLKSQIVPGITGYANDLIKLDTDAQRIDKVSEDIVNAISGIQAPQINTDMALNIGGNVYGDAALNATLERWKQQIIQEVQMRQAMAQQAIGGK